MAFVKLEDETGTVEVVVFPKTYADNKDALIADRVAFVEGKLEEREGDRKVIAEKVTLLDAQTAPRLRELLAEVKKQRPNSGTRLVEEKSEVCLNMPAKLAPSLATELKRVLDDHKGQRQVVLVLPGDAPGAAEKRIATSYYVALTGDAIRDIERLLGRGAVRKE